ncbi:hypothetical protein [Micromonospora rosaria]|uniref:hypothetical protein n=1 Tax=Micromonospora rosaria TaxID=47874 RepID=UPI000B1890F9|nr:hypothetical protein [Micromonospora rosaria]
MADHPPKRTRSRWSTSPHVSHTAGPAGFTGTAAAGRAHNVSEHRPFLITRPANRKDSR